MSVPTSGLSGTLCTLCKQDIDFSDGPIRMLGQPKSFPFCWDCFISLFSSHLSHTTLQTREEGNYLYVSIKGNPR